MQETDDAQRDHAFSSPLEEVRERWLSSLEDDDVVALCERLSDAVGRAFDGPDESLAVQVVWGLFALGELGPGLMTAGVLEVILSSVMPRHAMVPPEDTDRLLSDLEEALPFFEESGLVARDEVPAIRALLGSEGFDERVFDALDNVDLYDDEKLELFAEDLERSVAIRAAEKAAKGRALAKKKARNKAARQARRKQRR